MQSRFKPIMATDKVKVCKGNMCIEARGDNAKLLTLGFVFVLVCVGIAVLANK